MVMENKEQRVWMVITVVTVSVLVLIFAGITYAFFTTSDNEGSTAEIISDSGKMLINYEDGTNTLVVAEDVSPNNGKIIADKTFSVTGTNTTDGLIMPFSISLEYQNTFENGELMFFLKRIDNNEKIYSEVVVPSGNVGTLTQDVIDEVGIPQELLGYNADIIEDWSNNLYSQEIATGYFKPNSINETATFSLKMMFPDSGQNQDYNKGATFNGKIVINSDKFTTAVETVDKQLLTQDNSLFNSKIYTDSTLDKNVRYTMNDFLLNNVSSVSNNNVNYNVSDLNNNIKNNSLDYNFLSSSNTSNIINILGRTGNLLGIFNVKNADTGKYERMLKIILRSRDNVAFNTNGDNNWENSSLMNESNSETFLNEVYDFYKDKSIKQVSDSYDGVIANVEWDIGGVSDLNISLDNAYSMEKGLGTYTSNKKTWTGKIGLPSLSDLLYLKMSDSSCVSNISNCNNLSDDSSYYLTLTKNLNNASEVYSVDYDGNFKSMNVTSTTNSSVYLTFYLKSDIAFACGDGSLKLPYAISKDECDRRK